MLKIAICDDQSYDRKHLKNILEGISFANNIEISLDILYSGKEILDIYERDIPGYDIVFLDIILGDLNGIDVAKEIRKKDKVVKFIILSSSKEYILEGYDVSAISYMLKPAERVSIEKQLFRAIEEIKGTSEETYGINQNGKGMLFKLKNILFFEVNHRKITLHREQDSYEFYEKIENIEDELKSKSFERCHRSYVVNIAKIKELRNNEIVLIDGCVVPIGRKYKESVKKSFFNYLKLN